MSKNDSPKHVVYAVGHTHTDRLLIPSYFNNVAFVPEIIINDDEAGPYRKLNIMGSEVMDDLSGILILLPKKVFLKGEDAEKRAKAKIDTLSSGLYTGKLNELRGEGAVTDNLADAISRFNAARPLKNERPGELFYRTYLIRSNDFKKRMTNHDQVSNKLKELYGTMRMPKHVWVTEISTEDLLSQTDAADRLILGEVILDATANPYSNPVLSVHFPGVIWHFDLDAETVRDEVRVQRIGDDRAYRHLARLNG